MQDGDDSIVSFRMVVKLVVKLIHAHTYIHRAEIIFVITVTKSHIMLFSQPHSETGTVYPISQKKPWPRKLGSQNKRLSVSKFSAKDNGGFMGTKGDTVPRHPGLHNHISLLMVHLHRLC